MSVAVMSWVFQYSETSGNDRLVLLAIADRCNDEGWDAYPSIPSLARKARCSDRTVMRCLESLESIGAITIDRALGRSNRYRVVMQVPLSAPVTSCQGCQSDTGDNRVTPPLTPVSPPPVTLLSPNTSSTSSTSSTHTSAREASTEPGPKPQASSPEPPVLPFTRPARRAHQPGALAGSLPRDFVDQRVYGRLVVSAKVFSRWTLRYGPDPEAAAAAVDGWLARFAAALPPDAAIGDGIWLERHFDAWLQAQGRTPAAPASVTAPHSRQAAPTGRVIPGAAATRRELEEQLGGPLEHLR